MPMTLSTRLTTQPYEGPDDDSDKKLFCYPIPSLTPMEHRDDSLIVAGALLCHNAPSR